MTNLATNENQIDENEFQEEAQNDEKAANTEITPEERADDYESLMKNIDPKLWLKWFETMESIERDREPLTKRMAEVKKQAKESGVEPTDLIAGFARFKKPVHMRRMRDAAMSAANEAMGDRQAKLFDDE